MTDVTGRDFHIINEALAIAAAVIDLLPQRYRSESNRKDMRRILAAHLGGRSDYLDNNIGRGTVLALLEHGSLEHTGENEPFNRGFEAALAGVDLEHNPYSPDEKDNHELWTEGWFSVTGKERLSS